MSKIPADFIHNVEFIYEQICNKEDNILNEESEYYDQEIAELVEDIFYKISTEMIYEGYSVNGVISFLAYSSEDEIIEKYLNFDENIIVESLLSEEYIQEQFDILNEGLGSALGIIGRGIAKSVGPAARTAKVALKRAVGPGVRKAASKVKDVAGKVVSNLPNIAKGALAVGTGVLAGYGGAKLSGSGASPKTAPSGDKAKWNASSAAGGQAAFKSGGGMAKMKQTGMSAADVQKLGMKNIKNKPAAKASPTPSPTPSGSGSGGGAQSAKPTKPAKPSKPVSQLSPGGRKGNADLEGKTFTTGKTKGGTSYEVRTPTSAEMAASRAAGGGEAGVKASVERGSKLMGGPEGPGKIDTKSVEADIKAQQERDKRKAQQPVNASYEYDAYDLVLEYLFSTQQVSTVDEAHYVMLEMDSQMIQAIVEEMIAE